MLWIAGILAYLVLGLATVRAVHVWWLNGVDHEDPLVTIVAVLLWPGACVLAAVGGLIFGAHRLVTMPTAAQRRQRREEQREEERRRVDAQARALGLPTIGDDPPVKRGSWSGGLSASEVGPPPRRERR
jgi:hypothetical protein